MSKILGALSADLRTNSSQIDDLDGFRHQGARAVLNKTNLHPSLNGTYFNLGSSSNTRLVFEHNSADLDVDPVTNQKEFEYHALIQLDDGTNVGTNATLASASPDGDITNTGFKLRTTFNNLLAFSHFVNGSEIVAPLDFTLVNNAVIYVVLRGRSQSGAGEADGAYQMWLNGNLEASADDVAFFATGDEWDWEQGSVGLYETFGILGGHTNVRQMCIFDGWTSEPEVAPEFLQLRTINGSTFTDVGGDFEVVGSPLDALAVVSDTIDTSYIQTDTSGAEFRINFSDVNNFGIDNIVGLQLHARVSRGGLTSHEIDVGAYDSANDVLLEETVHQLADVAAVREVLNVFLDVSNLSGGLDDLSVFFRNGD